MEAFSYLGVTGSYSRRELAVMMNTTKSGITDENFYARMFERCRDDIERGYITILFWTGMHGSSLKELTLDNLRREGNRHYLKWRRLKTNKALEAPIPPDKLEVVRTFLASRRKPSLRWINERLQAMGKEAGYDGVSTMTFRHTRCIRLISMNVPLSAIKQMMGCSNQVIERAYGKYTPEQLRELMP